MPTQKAWGPTPEQLSKDAWERVQVENRAGCFVMKRVDPTPLDKLRSRDFINQRQYEAAQWLRNRWYWCFGSGILSADYEQSVKAGSTDSSEWSEICRTQYAQALEAVGPSVARVLIAIAVKDITASECVQEMGFNRHAGRPVICLALDSLADYLKIPA